MPTIKIYSKDQVDALIQGAGGLPDPTSASAGDVLTLDSNKDPAWVAPSGGSGVTRVQITSESELITFLKNGKYGDMLIFSPNTYINSVNVGRVTAVFCYVGGDGDVENTSNEISLTASGNVQKTGNFDTSILQIQRYNGDWRFRYLTISNNAISSLMYAAGRITFNSGAFITGIHYA